MSDYFSIDVDIPIKEDGKHYSKANKLSKEENKAFLLVNDNPKRLENYLNPFKKEDKVVLVGDIPERLQYAIKNPQNALITSYTANVSAILNRDYVNINYWDVYPNVIKNIHISNLKLVSNNSMLAKVRNFTIKILRKILFI